MSDWPIGLSTGCFYQRPILDVLEPIRDGGFTLLEICSSQAHLDYHREDDVKAAATAIGNAGLEPVSFHAPFADHIDITDLNQVRREAAVSELLTACDAAAVIGVRHIVLHPGPEIDCCPPDKERFKRLENGAASLNRVAAHCRQLGLRLQLENMLPHLMFGSASDVLYLLGAISDTTVGCCLDTGHANLSGDISMVVHKLSGHLQMLHANDNHRDWDAHLPPGHGNIDWRRLVAELEGVGFRGTIILELAGGVDEEPAIVLEKARDARRFLREIT
jgi:sugar phosphate isomerase/epimerase